MTAAYPLMTPEALETARLSAKVSRAEMADLMGISLGLYDDLCSGAAKLRAQHGRAASMALLALARRRDDVTFLPAGLREFAEALHAFRASGSDEA